MVQVDYETQGVCGELTLKKSRELFGRHVSPGGFM
jgi:hypothetical protein